MSIDERAFYRESQEIKKANLNCSYCKTTDEYSLRWLLRKKIDKLPRNGDERDRAKFAKAMSYMVLMEDKATCKHCRRVFDVSGIKTTAFL